METLKTSCACASTRAINTCQIVPQLIMHRIRGRFGPRSPARACIPALLPTVREAEKQPWPQKARHLEPSFRSSWTTRPISIMSLCREAVSGSAGAHGAEHRARGGARIYCNGLVTVARSVVPYSASCTRCGSVCVCIYLPVRALVLAICRS